MKKHICFKDINRADFKQFADCYRALSVSIMSDSDIVSQFNRVSFGERKKVCEKIKQLKVQRDRVLDQQFVLSVVDLHIIAAEYNLDPAVVCCIGADNLRNEFIRLH